MDNQIKECLNPLSVNLVSAFIQHLLFQIMSKFTLKKMTLLVSDGFPMVVVLMKFQTLKILIFKEVQKSY